VHLLIFLPCRLEQFLLAVKIRWYYNIGRGPVCSTDEEIATAFEEEHGGIRTAISEGLFPFFLKQDDVGTERDLATVFIEFGAALTSIDSVRFSVTECIKGNDIQEKRSCDSLVGALNGIFANGYTSHEDLDRQNGYVNEATFSQHTELNKIHRLLLGYSFQLIMKKENTTMEGGNNLQCISRTTVNTSLLHPLRY